MFRYVENEPHVKSAGCLARITLFMLWWTPIAHAKLPSLMACLLKVDGDQGTLFSLFSLPGERVERASALLWSSLLGVLKPCMLSCVVWCWFLVLTELRFKKLLFTCSWWSSATCIVCNGTCLLDPLSALSIYYACWFGGGDPHLICGAIIEMWCDVMWCGERTGDVVVWCGEMRGEMRWCCGVMWWEKRWCCGVIWWEIWCDVVRCVLMWWEKRWCCGAMWWDVVKCDVMWWWWVSAIRKFFNYFFWPLSEAGSVHVFAKNCMPSIIW